MARLGRTALAAAMIGTGLLAASCSGSSDVVAADVVATSASPTPAADAPGYGTCEELGPVFDQSEEYNVSFDPEQGVVLVAIPEGSFRVEIADTACLQKYPRVGREIANILEEYRRDQRSECRGVLAKLAADPSTVTPAPGREQFDLADPVYRARLVTYAHTLCAEVGIAVPDDLH